MATGTVNGVFPVLARYAAIVPSVARTADDPGAAMSAIFDRLEHAWGARLGLSAAAPARART
jgi:hypothetical protein